MTAGNLNATVGVEVETGKIEQRRRHHADVAHAQTGFEQAGEQRFMEARRSKPAIAPERHVPCPAADQQRADGPSEIDDKRRIEIASATPRMSYSRKTRGFMEAPAWDGPGALAVYRKGSR